MLSAGFLPRRWRASALTSPLTWQAKTAFPLVLAALALQTISGGFLGLAVAAISLCLVGHGALSERLGRNQRFASTGGLLAGCLIGLVSYFLSYRAIFFTTAALALPLLAALGYIRPDIHYGSACGAPQHRIRANIRLGLLDNIVFAEIRSGGA
jgi:hypothetical protein